MAGTLDVTGQPGTDGGSGATGGAGGAGGPGGGGGGGGGAKQDTATAAAGGHGRSGGGGGGSRGAGAGEGASRRLVAGAAPRQVRGTGAPSTETRNSSPSQEAPAAPVEGRTQTLVRTAAAGGPAGEARSWSTPLAPGPAGGPLTPAGGKGGEG